MKARLPFAALLAVLFLSPQPASADDYGAPFVELDVTKNPNVDKEIMTGYRSTYTRGSERICSVSFVATEDGRFVFKSDRPCADVTTKRVFVDALKAAGDLRATTYAKNFKEAKSAKEWRYRCMSIGADGYLFSPQLAPKQPGNWYKVYYFSGGGHVTKDPVGVWQFLLEGEAILSDVGHTGIGFQTLNMEEVYDCDVN